MAENSKIGWCHHTVNLWWGCYEVHKGCDNCYAKKFANIYHGPHVLWQQQGPRMMIKNSFADIKRYQKRAAANGVKEYIFMNSMSDIFEKSMPVVSFDHELALNDNDDYIYTSEIRQKFFKIVDECPNLIFLLLTKRPSNISKMIPEDWLTRPRLNVMFGTSVVDQETADTLIPQLIKVPGLHFLSMEPLIGEVNITQAKINYSVPTRYADDGTGIEWTDPGNSFIGVDWVIVGGESGGMAARPMNSQWVRDIKKQCDIAGVAFFHKQWGNWMPLNLPNSVGFSFFADGSKRTAYYEQKIDHKFMRSNDQTFYYTGEHNEDARLDGVEHKAFPI